MILLLAILADFIFGSPDNFPNASHLMSFIIEKEEKLILKSTSNPSTIVIMGGLVSILNIVLCFLASYAIIQIFAFNQKLQFAVMVHMAYMSLNIKALKKEAGEIKREMKRSTERGRRRMKSFVTRDTKNLSEAGIIRACVEAVAKNSCDWAIGPLTFLIFGPAFALSYRMVCLMDDKLSGRPKLYEGYGLVNSYLYKIINFIPARLTSLFLLLGSIIKYNVKKAFKITLRDHKKHENINTGWPQATMAGLLEIRLGGGSFYNGIYIEKPLIGDDKRPVRAKDIDDSVKISYRSVIAFALVYGVIYFLVTRS